MTAKEHYVSTITSKGQVTVPVAIRRRLSIGPHAKVAFVVEGDQVRLIPATSVTARTAGALKSDEPMLSPRSEKDAAESMMTDEAEAEAQGTGRRASRK